MTTEYIITIIVPIYNNEAFLQEALNSLSEQDLDSVEIVLVNDGSTDLSPDIIEAFRHTRPHIKTLHTENQGVSAARNLGIHVSSGQFLCFLDGDDIMHPNSISEFKRIIGKHSPDIIIGGATQFSNESNMMSQRRYTQDTGVLNIEDSSWITREYIHGNYDHANWNKCYKSSIIKANDVHFIPELSSSEDMIFNWHFWSHARTVQFTEYSIIAYRIHDTSVTRTSDRPYMFLSCLAVIHDTRDKLNPTTFLHAIQYMQRKLWFEIFTEFSFSKHSPSMFLRNCRRHLHVLFTLRSEYTSINRRNFIVDKLPGLIPLLTATLTMRVMLKKSVAGVTNQR